jgi:hypothetical protein
VDAELVDEQRGQELVPAQHSATLWRTDDPALALERMTATADALKGVIEKQQLYKTIRGNSHVLVEGWLTLGAMLGVTPFCEWTRPVENGWEARVLARTLDGRTVGAAEAQCLSSEGKPWNTADGHAIRSMAQTRATSKALASVLRFVVTLAGYQGTPAEDMGAPPEPDPATDEQITRLEVLLMERDVDPPDLALCVEWAKANLTAESAQQTIAALEKGDEVAAKVLNALIVRARQEAVS